VQAVTLRVPRSLRYSAAGSRDVRTIAVNTMDRARRQSAEQVLRDESAKLHDGCDLLRMANEVTVAVLALATQRGRIGGEERLLPDGSGC
jgi:hypothetical protein